MTNEKKREKNFVYVEKIFSAATLVVLLYLCICSCFFFDLGYDFKYELILVRGLQGDDEQIKKDRHPIKDTYLLSSIRILI